LFLSLRGLISFSQPLRFTGNTGRRRAIKMSTKQPDYQDDILEEIDKKTTEPPMYKVLLHNDDYTTKAFVVEVLIVVFNKSIDAATRLMWQVHRNGVGVCGVYPFEMAETKINLVTNMARENGFPLKTSVEKE
jgi:ATP-dependent Clp protease adaptor protein ClpS